MPFLVFPPGVRSAFRVRIPKPPQPQTRISCLRISVWSVEREYRSLRNETTFLDN